MTVKTSRSSFFSILRNSKKSCAALEHFCIKNMGKMGLFLKYSAQCPYFQTIKHRVSILKLDFLKIKFQCNSILMFLSFR